MPIWTQNGVKTPFGTTFSIQTHENIVFRQIFKKVTKKRSIRTQLRGKLTIFKVNRSKQWKKWMRAQKLHNFRQSTVNAPDCNRKSESIARTRQVLPYPLRAIDCHFQLSIESVYRVLNVLFSIISRASTDCRGQSHGSSTENGLIFNCFFQLLTK